MVLPSGTVTFLFSDVEGSTQLLERFPAAMGAALARHHELFEEIVAVHDGAIFETVGDAVYAAFARAPDAAAAALRIQLALASEDWGPVGRIACRLALHTGEVERRGSHYFGPALFRCARLQALGYGEQTLLSGLTADLVRDHLPGGASLTDLGTHRLKDLGEPEHVFALLHPDLRHAFPPPKSVDSHPNNLPLQLSSFVGRERELEQLDALVRAHRLTTITGSGGMGKTRLALQLAGQLLGEEPNAAFFVDLAPVREADQIIPTVAGTIGLTAAAGSSLEAAVAGYLGTLRALLVLDNTEQIAGSGPPILDLLERTPDLRAIVTSRTPVHVRGERIFPLAPLPIGAGPADAGEPATVGPAIRLFVERAAEVLPSFELTDANRAAVAGICESLDGLPLAIELAAARLTVFEPMALLTRLDQRLGLLTGGAVDQPKRHQTLRATIDWSFQLLTDADQAAFARLSVFAGGWTLEAATAVAHADPDGHGRLISASLVHRTGDRFQMLETVREFAAERMAEASDLPQTRLRHARWYDAWVAELLTLEGEDDLRSAVATAKLVEERENLELAVTFFLKIDDGESALRMCEALWLFWMSHGRARQVMGWMQQALKLVHPKDSPGAAWPLALLGELAMWCGEADQAIVLKERAIAQVSGDSIDAIRAAAAIHHDLAYLWANSGQLDKAERAAATAVELREKVGLPRGIAHALSAAGWVEEARGNFNAAHGHYTAAVEQARLDGDPVGVMYAVCSLADIERRLLQPSKSASSWCEVLATVTARGDTEMDSFILRDVGELLTDVGRADQAAELLGAASSMRQRNGMEEQAAEFNRAYERARMALSKPDFEGAWMRGEAMTRDQALLLAAEASQQIATEGLP